MEIKETPRYRKPNCDACAERAREQPETRYTKALDDEERLFPTTVWRGLRRGRRWASYTVTQLGVQHHLCQGCAVFLLDGRRLQEAADAGDA